MSPDLIFLATMVASTLGFGSLAWLCDRRAGEHTEDAERERRRQERRIEELAPLTESRRGEPRW